MKKFYALFAILFITVACYGQGPNTWTQKSDLGYSTIQGPYPREGATSFSIGTKGYVGMGYGTGYKNDFWEWDQATNTWTQKANFGGTAREFATGFAIGNK